MQEGSAAWLYSANFAKNDSYGHGYSSHLQLYEEIHKRNRNLQIVCAGSLKANGEWSYNSALNSEEVQKCIKDYGGMNGPISSNGQLPFQKAREKAQQVGQPKCSENQMAFAKKNWDNRIRL